MNLKQYSSIKLQRDCKVTLIPSGQQIELPQGECVTITQALGGSYTVRTEMGYLARVASLDADALGFDVTFEEQTLTGTTPFNLEKVIEKLKTVFDPEIPINVVDLGLIYVCKAHSLVDGGYLIEIKMSMTAPGCGMGDVLKADAHEKVRMIPGVIDVDIEIVWEPPWDQSRMSEAARLQLGIF